MISARFHIVAARLVCICPNALEIGCVAERVGDRTRRIHHSPGDGVSRHDWRCSCPWASENGKPEPEFKR